MIHGGYWRYPHTQSDNINSQKLSIYTTNLLYIREQHPHRLTLGELSAICQLPEAPYFCFCFFYLTLDVWSRARKNIEENLLRSLLFISEWQTRYGGTTIMKSRYSVLSIYIAVVGVHGMAPRYKWERDISGGCQKSTSCSLFQRDMSDNGEFACVATNSGRRQRLVWSLYQNSTLHNKTAQYNVQTRVISAWMTNSKPCILRRSMPCLPCCFVQRSNLIKPRYIQLSANISRNSDDVLKILKICVYRIAGAQAAVISRFCDRILNQFASWINAYFGVHDRKRNAHQSRASTWFATDLSQCLHKMADVNTFSATILLKMHLSCPDQRSVARIYMDTGLIKLYSVIQWRCQWSAFRG